MSNHIDMLCMFHPHLQLRIDKVDVCTTYIDIHFYCEECGGKWYRIHTWELIDDTQKKPSDEWERKQYEYYRAEQDGTTPPYVTEDYTPVSPDDIGKDTIRKIMNMSKEEYMLSSFPSYDIARQCLKDNTHLSWARHVIKKAEAEYRDSIRELVKRELMSQDDAKKKVGHAV